MAIVMITGCSSGFGEAIAHAFAARGDRVIATMRRPADASDRLRGSERIRVIPLDVTNENERDAAVRTVFDDHGRIDVLVNNAGVVMSASIENSPDQLTRQLFETNFFGPLALMKAVLPIMRAQELGRIVNVTAIGAIYSTPLLGIYCAAKHALDSASAALDIEGRPFGVRALSVLPGQFRTEIGQKAPAPIVTPPYLAIAQSMANARQKRIDDVLTDLSPVADAVVAAATDLDPRPRYLVGRGIALELASSIAELERLHQLDVVRSGTG